ncbi:glycosyl hydrolase [Hymenobacter cavernae]|uniref:DNA-binding protein n=1 Tax=Hymenobacter cavernae TaxID=2044852 RepID=A0ABQ1U4R0_9BACT|nr:glycosyl hydrolase [Hymenobacter cavernae]GGF09503.1 DNA-binding protein [Hymenobacter cavernae]
MVVFRRWPKPQLLVCLALTALPLTTWAQDTGAALEQGFKNPPEAAWPRTWWHWTNSNITKEGITKDLEWMKRSGIAGFQLADVGAGSGQTVNEKIVFGTPAWLDAVKHTAAEADRLGLEMTMFTSPGWSLTGAPWVKPEQAMKKLVWSELQVEGGKTFKGKLPQPPSVEGAIRNLARSKNSPATGYYGETAVIAFRTPTAEADETRLQPTVTTNAGPIDAKALLDDNLNTSLTVRPTEKRGTAWVQYSFKQPTKVQAFTVAGTRGIPFGRLQASSDGKQFTTLTALPGKQGYRGGTVRTFSIPTTTARYYRLELSGAPMKPAEVISEAAAQPDSSYALNEFQLHTGARVNRWEDKAGFNFLFEYESTATPPVAAPATISPTNVVVLTSKMQPDGTLTWQVPPGKWTILRMGYSLTGARNRPAVPAANGLEVDKLSRKHTEAYMQGYTEPLRQALGPLYGKSLRYMLMDSWEAGIQNWTDEMLPEFQKRRGYDLTPYLPVLAGRVVGSAEISDRVLWDFRRTLVDMFAENHYGTVTDYLHKQGIQTYGEAGGVSLETIEDALLYKKYVDIPMGEFWVKDLHPSSMYYEDVRGAASSGHVYGKNLIAAESFTGGNYESPYTLKKISDYWFTQGINRLVFHTSAHQPLDTKPGNTMVGTHLNRNITWAEQSKPLMTYLARNTHMLQQGQYVADVAYLLNEGAPSTMPFWGAGLQPALPEGYAFDYINADALITRMSVNDKGRLVLPDGMSYGVLVLPEIGEMTLPVLRKVRELAQGGATIVGPKPVKAPGLTAYPSSDPELQAIASEVWGDLDGRSRTKCRYGKGQIVWGLPLAQVMSLAGLTPDVTCSRPLGSEVPWIHRRVGDADVYYVVNRSDSTQDLKAQFRVSGKDVALWHPATGQTEPAGYTISGGQTTVPLHLKERETVFVVFNHATSATARAATPVPTESTLLTVAGPWRVTFAPKLGAPAEATFPQLASWTDNADAGIKYFSGTATYHKTLEASKKWFHTGRKIMLDLGSVGDIAEVTVNGQKVDLLWQAPFQADVTNLLKPGKNQVEIQVTNEWTNRLIGDKLAGPDKKVLDSYTAPFGGQYQLGRSGLLGPVRIMAVEKVDAPGGKNPSLTMQTK